jgi:acetyl esterase/lipase
MPGGGYTHLVMEGEGAAEARFLAAHNISAFVLAYRLAPAYPFPAPMLDAARALRYVRAHAAELGVLPDHIALWGFSAGGHLTAWMSVNKAAPDPDFPGVSARPDAAIISYGRFDLSPAGPHPDPAKTPTMQSVLHATTVDLDILPKVSAAGAAGLIPPTFLYSTSGDQTVDSRNASNYYTGLKAANIPAELHIFELGPHGTHMGMDRPPAEHELTILPVLLLNWLEIHGWNPTLSDPAK